MSIDNIVALSPDAKDQHNDIRLIVALIPGANVNVVTRCLSDALASYG